MTGSLTALALAMLAFVASHAIPANPRLRGPLVRMFGLRPYLLAYSLLSLAVIAWVAVAYRAAPYVELWPQAPWMRWVPPIAMALACLLLVTGLTTPNPFSVGRGARGYDPAHPGILRVTRHPFLWGLVLWAGGHILPNGDAASLILFGPLLALTSLSIPLTEARKKGATPPPARGLPSLAEIGWKRIGGAVLFYVLLFGAHPHVIGVSPLP